MKKLSVLILFLPALLSAHGISGEVQQLNEIVVVRFSYEDGEPLPMAKVTIFFNESEYQNGRTDLNGYFVFLAKEKGSWKVECDDQLGHKKVLKIVVAEKVKQEKMETAIRQFSLFENLAIYVLKIFLTLLAIYLVFKIYLKIKR